MVGEGDAGGGGRPLAFNKSDHDVSSFDIDDLPLSTAYRHSLRPPNSSLDPADRKYTIRIYRANNTYHVVSVGFQVTVANLRPKLNNSLLMDKETETHRLYLEEKGRERILASTERPADIVRRRLEQAGYDIADGLELLGGDGLSFLLKFVYKSQLLGPAEEDIKVPSYSSIDLGGRSLRTIPVSLHRHAYQIISLSLSRNPMLDIPLDFIQSCTTLQELRLSNMAMKKVPHSVKYSPTLLRLDLSCNRIADLDEAFLDQIPGLQELYVQNNCMEKLSWYFPRMRSLTTLNISNNKFRAIPPVVCVLESLRYLDVSFNLLQELPEEIGLLIKLERFIMVGNQVSSFPDEMRELLSLRYLDCRRNQIGDFAEVCTLPNLETLCADHNALHALDLSLGSRLMCLDASHNEITKLTLAPGPMGKTYALTTLDISYAKLSSFDDLALASLTTLRTLKLDHNKFTSIPETLGDLAWLETLSCAENSLGALPNSIGCLQRLEILDAHSNNLTAIPDSLWNCRSLFKINLTSNLLCVWHPPPTTNSSPDIRIPPPQYPERKASAASLNSRLPSLARVLEKLFLAENHFTDDMLHALTVLRELRVLNLSFNNLQDIPPSFLRSFSKLEELYLSGNKLVHIPTEDLPKLTRLSVLYLNGNRLRTLPQELAKVKSLMVLDVGNNLLNYNINNWEFDWNWNFNKNLKYLNLSGNKRLQIKSDIPTRPKSATVASQASLAGFSHLTQLRVLGLIDVKITTTGADGALDIPDESDDRRVRTSHSTVCGMPYGIADTLGRNENLHMIDLVHEFLGRKDEAVFAMFGRALPPKNILASSNRMAKYLHDRFIEVLLVQINALLPQNNEGLPDALRRTFLKLNQDLHSDLQADDILTSKSGASGIVLYFVGKRLHVANAGNALAIISRGGSVVPVSQKHDPYDRLEMARIRNVEGWISPTGLVNDEIDISRSFGFFHLLPMVNARPFISSWEITEHDEFVIVGNRGLWDFVSYQTAVDIARRELDPMIAAQKLRDLVMSYGADGSTMVMVIGVKDLFKDNHSRRETLESLVDLQLFNNKQLLRPPGNKPTIIDRNISRLPLEIPPPTGHIAIVFTDIQNLTRLWQVNSGTHTAIRIHNSLLRRQLRFCGGYEVKTERGSFICSFPTSLSALWWCFTVQQQLLEAEWPLEILECSDGQPISDNQNRLIARGLSVRMGIHCGTPLCEPDPITSRMDYFGPMVNRSAQIMGSAAGGQIMCSVDVVREINAKILETEPETEYSYYQPPEAIDEIKRLGLVVIPVGEVQLKDLEVPEMLSLVYPSGLEGRQDLSELLTDPKTDPNSGSRVAFNVEQMRELGLLCLRLEALATGRLFRPPLDRKVSLALTDDDDEATLRRDNNSLYLYGDLTLLLPSMSDTSSDDDLMLIMDSLSGRIENAIAAISGRASPITSHLETQLQLPRS
ncbi:adenylate cyclase [Mycena floridula]|nr:adenylate cyclase [Mycena floridula]